MFYYLFAKPWARGRTNIFALAMILTSCLVPLYLASRLDAPDYRRRGEQLSTDCISKRSEILQKQKNISNNNNNNNGGEHKIIRPKQSGTTLTSMLTVSTGLQRLKPKQEPQMRPTPSLLPNNTLETQLYQGHIPQCTSDGRFEPIQCHAIVGWCWCVNKFGQAIKNTAVHANQRPTNCDPESRSVVSGVSAARMKNLLKYGNSTTTSNSLSAHANGASDYSAQSVDLDQDLASSARQAAGGSDNQAGSFTDSENEFSRRVSASEQPSLALVPHECEMSRNHAQERATKHTDDSIWIPECDSNNTKLYLEKQCHKGRVCWCVDQITGLPMRAREQLKPQISINCTKLSPSAYASYLEAVSVSTQEYLSAGTNNSNGSDVALASAHLFTGFSEVCDAEKRAEFVQFLINQFRHQVLEHFRNNPTSQILQTLQLPNNQLSRMNDEQVSRVKFTILDHDLDGILNDREWARFKGGFKVVDKYEEARRIFEVHSSSLSWASMVGPGSVASGSITPLVILRSQRRCWRDFLEFCSDGDILNSESVNQQKWLNCTELPSELELMQATVAIGPDGRTSTGRESVYANTKEAAIIRSQKKNPFLGILKPD